MNNILSLTFLLSLSILLSSCSFQNILETKNELDYRELMTYEDSYEHIISADDKITVSIWNHENISIGSLFGTHNNNEVYGRWIFIDAQGYAMMPKLGNIKLGGLTCKQAADTLTKYYEKMLIDPILVVKVLNKSVTVLGEVKAPGTYPIDKDKNTLSEVIGLAQGFMFYANKEKVQLIRNNKSYKIDFTKLKDNNYQILVLSGDVINIPSRKGKSLDQKAPTLIPFASAITAIVVAATLIQ